MNFNFSIARMEGTIGGSVLDDLRDIMGIGSLNDGDIVFAIDGGDLIARCVHHKTPDYKFLGDPTGKDMPDLDVYWEPIP